MSLLLTFSLRGVLSKALAGSCPTDGAEGVTELSRGRKEPMVSPVSSYEVEQRASFSFMGVRVGGIISSRPISEE
jgi:hypothetical protein